MFIMGIDVIKNSTCPEGMVQIHYAKQNVGFGTVEFILENGKPYANTNFMGKELLKEVLDTLYNEIELVEPLR